MSAKIAICTVCDITQSHSIEGYFYEFKFSLKLEVGSIGLPLTFDTNADN